MRKAKEIANEICVVYADAIMHNKWKLFTDKMGEVFYEVCITDVHQLRQIRNVKLDRGLIPIFKEQRQKYNAICRIVNVVKSDLLSVKDFDEAIQATHPSIYEWYVANVVNGAVPNIKS